MLFPESETNYIPLESSYVFKCEINCRPLMASIKGEYKYKDQFGYQVNFSDGFKTIFVAGEQGWQCEKKAALYLEQIKLELNKFTGMQACSIMKNFAC